MRIEKRIRFSTQAEPSVLIASQRTGSLNHLSGTVCTDGILNVNCRVDTTGNISAVEYEEGNTVYNLLTGLTKFNGNNLYYKLSPLTAGVGDHTFICRINIVGIITEISTTCTIV